MLLNPKIVGLMLVAAVTVIVGRLLVPVIFVSRSRPLKIIAALLIILAGVITLMIAVYFFSGYFRMSAGSGVN